jgi:hypothetical protein
VRLVVTGPALILTMLMAMLLAWQAAQSRGGEPAIRRWKLEEPEPDALYDEELWRGP